MNQFKLHPENCNVIDFTIIGHAGENQGQNFICKFHDEISACEVTDSKVYFSYFRDIDSRYILKLGM